MIQNLYYASGALSQSLLFEPDNETLSQTWDIDNLVVCASLYQIMAFSSSTLVASFPIEGTNLFNGYISSSYITGSEPSTESVDINFTTPIIPFDSNPTQNRPSVVQVNYNFTTNAVSSSFKIISLASASIGQNYATASITLASAFTDQTEARIAYDTNTYRFIAEADPLNMDQPPYLYFFSTGSTATATATNLSMVINRALSGSLASSSLDVIYASGSGANLILSGSQSGSYANGITFSTGSSNNFSLQGTMEGGTNVTVSQTSSYVDLTTGGNGSVSFNLDQELTVEVTGSNSEPFYSSDLSIYNYSTQTSIFNTSSINSNLSASFTASGLTYYTDVIATVNELPYIQLSYNTTGGIPVTPTSSLENWNNYLGITASLVVNSGSTVYLIGDQISNVVELAISSSDSELTAFKIYKGTNLTNFDLSDIAILNPGLLSSFPNLSGSNQLRSVRIQGTELTSSVAPYLVNTNLQTFNINDNRVSGSIQDILNTLPSESIESIDTSYNCLTGSIPVLSSSINLRYFSCSFNQLSGSIGSFLGCLNLIEFDCSHNALTGSITGSEDLISIQRFDASSNRLSGSFPSFVSSSVLEYLDLNTNYLTGSVPYLLDNTSLAYINYSFNQFTDEDGIYNKLFDFVNIPSSVTYYDCSYNRLSGSLIITGSSNLVSFNASNNNFTSSLDEGGNVLEGCTSLQNYVVSYNNISGTLPPLGGNISLTDFIANNNQISTVSSSFTVPPTLTNFTLENNNLTTASVDNVAAAFYTTFSPTTIFGIINVSGSGNAPPDTAAIAYFNELTASGWTIYANNYP